MNSVTRKGNMLKKTSNKAKRNPEQKEKEDIFKLLSDKYKEAPADMWSYYPDIASKLDNLFTPKKSPKMQDSIFYSYLTERERDFRINSLVKTVERFKKGEHISKEEGVRALEDVAALQKHASEYKETILAILGKTLQFPFGAKEITNIYFQKGKPEHHTYTLARGIILSLTWDGTLIKIAFDPKEFATRQKLLSIVGIGSDTATDVARRHDDYLEDAFGH